MTFQALRSSTQHANGTARQNYASTMVLQRNDGRLTGRRDEVANARWAKDACPFQEARHSCFFTSATNAEEAATLAEEDDSPVHVKLLRALAGRRLLFVG